MLLVSLQTRMNIRCFCAPRPRDANLHPKMVAGRWQLPGDGQTAVLNSKVAKEEDISVGDYVIHSKTRKTLASFLPAFLPVNNTCLRYMALPPQPWTNGIYPSGVQTPACWSARPISAFLTILRIGMAKDW